MGSFALLPHRRYGIPIENAARIPRFARSLLCAFPALRAPRFARSLLCALPALRVSLYERDSLTEKGWREARYLSERIADLQVRDFYVSPLGRAKDTASCTLEKMGRTAVECPIVVGTHRLIACAAAPVPVLF